MNANNEFLFFSSSYQLVPPIIITKAHSVASVDSSLKPSSSALPQQHPEDEKPPVIIEERTQEHQYGTPPADTNEFIQQDKQVDVKEVKPIVIMQPDVIEDPSVVPATEIPEAKQAAEEAGILPATPIIDSNVSSDFSIIVRLSSDGKDVTVPIPTNEPYITIAELKSKLPHDDSHNSIRLIHLGRILKDDFILVPSNSPSSSSNIVKISNHGVIQAMLYQQ